jgi:CBS domain containing-hemolysin-like protein
MVTLFNIVLILVLVFANGFFVASEFALVGVRRSRVETLAALGNGNAQRLLGLLNNLNVYISATQLGITMASLALGWIGEPVFAHLLEAPLKDRVSEITLHRSLLQSRSQLLPSYTLCSANSRLRRSRWSARKRLL